MFTYDDFYKAAEEAGLLNQFSQSDLALAQRNPGAGMSLLGYKQDYGRATTDDQRVLANVSANSLREKYGGYSGGSAGADYRLNADTPGSYTSPSFESPYTAKKDDYLGRLENRSFSYDPETDISAQAYKKMYTREGERATKDAMGTASAMTGGIPSTYAVTAGAQAGQYYASQLSDATAKLEQQAYNRYMQEKNIDLAILDSLSSMENTDYSRFSNDRNFDYAKLLDKINYLDGREQGRQKLDIDAANTMAGAGEFDRLAQMLNLTAAETETLRRIWQEQNAPRGRGGGVYRVGSGVDTELQPDAERPWNEIALEVNSTRQNGWTYDEMLAWAKENKDVMTDSEYRGYIMTINAKKAEEKGRAGGMVRS